MTLAETWCPVLVDDEPYPYEVSDRGRVRRSEPGHSTRPGKVLKPRPRGGYPSVTLCKNGKRRDASVHLLVARAFHGPCPDEHECNHKDGDPSNPRADNLEWVTKSENHLHAHRVLGRKPNIAPSPGEANGNAKVTARIVRQIRREYAAGGVTLAALGERYGVDFSTIGKIVRGDAWGHVGGPRTCSEVDNSTKLDAATVSEIRQRYAIGDVSQRALANEYGVSGATIGHIVRRETWAHI